MAPATTRCALSRGIWLGKSLGAAAGTVSLMSNRQKSSLLLPFPTPTSTAKRQSPQIQTGRSGRNRIGAGLVEPRVELRSVAAHIGVCRARHLQILQRQESGLAILLRFVSRFCAKHWLQSQHAYATR